MLEEERQPHFAQDQQFKELYSELHGLAAFYLQHERTSHTLQPTALVNEAYLRLAPEMGVIWASRDQFLGVAAMIMRRVLVDHARKRSAAKRSGQASVLTISSSDPELTCGSGVLDLVALDEALTRLELLHARQARLVQLHVFGGIKVDDAATLLGIAPSTAFKDWEMAKTWLARELSK